MTRPGSKSNISNYFYKGKYSETLEITGLSPIDLADSRFEFKTSFQLAALVFLGRFREALVLFERAVKISNVSQLFLSRCRFFLGIGCVRQSDYSGAVRYFSQNVSVLKKNKIEMDKDYQEFVFYAFQGSAFYRFFRGQFEKANQLTKKAYAACYESNFKYGQVLSLDLMGHSLCQIGAINRGLRELESALEIAEKLGNGGIITAINISLVKYRAQFGINVQKSVMDLEEAIVSLQPQDTYSKAELYLELIRQFVLRGNGTQAKRLLETAGKLIYEHQNKRQYATFNLRFAHLQLLNNEPQAALALAVSLKGNLDSRVDLVILQQTEGLIKKIKSTFEDVPNIQSGYVSQSGNVIDSRIRHREQKNRSMRTNAGEDRLGDILDMIGDGDTGILYEVKKLGLFGLVPIILKVPVGTNGIYLGPSRREIIIFSGADVVWIDQGITASIKKLLLNLNGRKFKSKEFLVNKTWGYSYDPSVHDRLLHATIGKLRGLLGAYGYWIEWASEGYRLASPVFSPFEEEKQAIFTLRETENRNRSTPQQSTDLGLNIRQFKFIKKLKQDEFISVRNYAKLFKVCNMTACRDLTDLHLSGRVLRMGKGRATVYRLP